MNISYHSEKDKNNINRLREKLFELPEFLEEFFLSLSERTSTRTRLAYAYDLKIFFTYLKENSRKFKDKAIEDFSIEDLETVTALDIRKFLAYLSSYTRCFVSKYSKEIEKDVKNMESGKSRKLASVRAMFSYCYKSEKLSKNVADLVEFPKRHSKNITRLEEDEVSTLLNEIEEGNKLSEKQLEYHSITKKRDLAIVTLMLGTGIRISECIGIDINHIDFKNGGIKITRKGGNEDIVFFGKEVEFAILEYIEEREIIIPQKGHENALFLSIQNRRISDRAVQNLVKKYACNVIPIKNITPHKLRSTYGTNLYQETGDIYLVAEILGHSDVNTTKKHYVHMPLERRKAVANTVRLRNP